MNRMTASVLFTVLVANLCMAADRGPSTPEERTRFVQVTNRLIEDPRNDAQKSDLRWAFTFLAEVPDIQVALCGPVLDPLLQDNKEKSASFTMIHTFAMAVFAIEHPEKVADQVAMNQAGIDGVLLAYKNAQARDPKFKLKSLDSFRRMQTEGNLAAFVKKSIENCKEPADKKI